MAHLNLIDAASRTRPMAKKKKWMQAAVPKGHEGKFTAKAKAAGRSVTEYAKAEAHAPGVLGKEARLAETFEGAAKKKSRMRDVYKSKG